MLKEVSVGKLYRCRDNNKLCSVFCIAAGTGCVSGPIVVYKEDSYCAAPLEEFKKKFKIANEYYDYFG